MNGKTNFELKRELISQIFQKHKDDNIQIAKLAKIINLSTKHTRRLWKEFKQNKSVPLFHNLKNKQSIRKKDCTNFISEYKTITKKLMILEKIIAIEFLLLIFMTTIKI